MIVYWLEICPNAQMRDFWEETVHIIVSRTGNNGVKYKVKQEYEGNCKVTQKYDYKK